MVVLAFDTTSEQGGAGIYLEQEPLAHTANSGPANQYSVTLFEMVNRLLKEANLTLLDIELFAVANGPGSFTGIRVGVAAAQGWATALNRPVLGVSVLEAMTNASSTEAEWAIPILDARRGEFYMGCYRRAPGLPVFELEGEARVLKPSALRSFLEEFASTGRGRAAATCIVREHDRLSAALRSDLPASFAWQSVRGSLVGTIAQLAFRARREGRLQSPAGLDACYIRRSDAELFVPRVSKAK